MKLTLTIDDVFMVPLQEEAARRGVTVSELVEDTLRRRLERRATQRGSLPPLPEFDLGKPAVDIAARNALYRAMEGR